MDFNNQNQVLPPVGYKLVTRIRSDGAQESYLVKLGFGFEDEGCSFTPVLFFYLLMAFLSYIGGCFESKGTVNQSQLPQTKTETNR